MKGGIINMSQGQTGSQNSLPVSYNQTYIRIVPKDPYVIYSYWEITTSTRLNFQAHFGLPLWEKSEMAIKIHDLSGDNCNYIRIDDQSDHCYINFNKPGCMVMAEVGKLVSDQFFVSFAGSNIVQMPYNRIISDQQACFIDVKQSKDIRSKVDTDQIYEKFNFHDVSGILGPSSPGYPRFTDTIEHTRD